MMRILPCLFLLAATLAAQDQTPVDITDESHYRLLLKNDQVRIFEVEVPAHTTLPLVRHDHNFLVVTLQDCEIASWAEGNAGVITYRYNNNDIRFFYGGPARALRNDTPNTYRNLTIEFLNPKVTTFGYQPEAGHWEYGSSAMSPPVDSQAKFNNVLKLDTAMVKDVQLLPDNEYPAPEKPVDELLIPLTDVDLKAPDQRIRKAREDLVWIPFGRKNKWTNDGVAPARFVIIEFQPAAD